MTRLGAMPTLTDYDAALSSIMADHASPGVQVPCLRPSQRYIVGVYGGAEGGSRFTVQAAEIHSDGTAPRITGARPMYLGMRQGCSLRSDPCVALVRFGAPSVAQCATVGTSVTPGG